MDNLVATATIEEQVLPLSSANMELTAKDLQKWTIAYKEDKGRIAGPK